MPHAYLLEIEQDAVGLIIREEGGYRFHAARRSLAPLQENLFDTAHQARCAVIDRCEGAAQSVLTPLHARAPE
jgi:hypothetical protein